MSRPIFDRVKKAKPERLGKLGHPKSSCSGCNKYNTVLRIAVKTSRCFHAMVDNGIDAEVVLALSSATQTVTDNSHCPTRLDSTVGVGRCELAII